MAEAGPAASNAPKAARRARVAPANAREAMVCRLFGEALGDSQFSVTDNFFEQGGHSLLAARLIARLTEETGSKIPLRRVFEHPTPRELAAALDAPLAPAGKESQNPALILFPGGGVVTRQTLRLRQVLSDDFDVTMIDYPDWRDDWDIFFSFDKYLAHVVAQVRDAAPASRPLRLLGYSFGGGVAYAVSILLKRLGYTIEFLGAIDARSPTLGETGAADAPDALSVRVLDFFRRDGLSRSRQLGRFVGVRAKKPVVKALLKWARPLLPRGQSSEFAFYLTQFINASIPMQAIRNWTRELDPGERLVDVRSALFRSRDSGDHWPRDLGWKELAPAMTIKMMPGDHFTVIDDGNIPALRAILRGEPASGAGRFEPAESTPRAA